MKCLLTYHSSNFPSYLNYLQKKLLFLDCDKSFFSMKVLHGIPDKYKCCPAGWKTQDKMLEEAIGAMSAYHPTILTTTSTASKVLKRKGAMLVENRISTF